MRKERTALWQRVGLVGERPWPDFDQVLEGTLSTAMTKINAGGQRFSGGPDPQLVMPPTLGEMVHASAMLEANLAGQHSALAVENIRSHYLDWMPTILVGQLTTTKEPTRTFFHEPLPWDRLPRFYHAIDGLFELLQRSGVDPEPIWGAADAEAFRRRYPTLFALYQSTYHGALMPLLYGLPNDMLAYEREIAAGADLWDVFDRRLAGPVVHDLLHMGRDRAGIFPLYLEECVTGYLSIYLLRDFAFPAGDANNALYRAPWFSQVGLAMVRAFGLEAVVRCHTGTSSWDDLHPGLTDTMDRLGWAQHLRVRAPHFLGEITHPMPWVTLFQMCQVGAFDPAVTLETLETTAAGTLAPGEPHPTDRAVVIDALDAMCLAPTLDVAVFRVSWQAPPCPVTLDFEACTASRPEPGIEPDPVHALPPYIAATMRQRGIASQEVTITSRADILRITDQLTAP